MNNEKATDTKASKKRDDQAQPTGALTISQFCELYALDPSTFHRQRKHMPRTIRIGRSGVRIPRSAIGEWEREQLERDQRRQQSAR